jgi:molybdopterin molybdotransferase
MSKGMLSYDEALARLLDCARVIDEVESIATQDAAGRVLARDLISAIDVPPLDNTSMDGYAVRCADVTSAGCQLQVAQRIAAGSVGHTLAPATAAHRSRPGPMRW